MRYVTSEGVTVLGKFNTSDTVEIGVFNLADNSAISITNSDCTEIGATGVFKWSTADLTTQPQSYSEFMWTMTNSVYTQYGKVVLNGYPASLMGLMNENVYIDQTSFDSNGNLVEARLRTYSNAGDVGTGDNVLGTYIITGSGTAFNQFSSWKQVRQ